MTFCSKCGVAQPEGAKFCTECGAPIRNDSIQIVEDHPQAPIFTVQNEVRHKKKKKSLLRRWWFWVVIIVVAVAVLGKRGGQKPTKAIERQVETVATAKPVPTAQPAATPKPAATAAPTPKPVPTPTTAPEVAAAPTGVSPEFKATMDSYEAFFDEYITFMKAMSDDPNNTAMLLKYATMMMQYTETMEKLDAIDESKLSPADDAYYIEVMARIEVKLLQAAQYMQ